MQNTQVHEVSAADWADAVGVVTAIRAASLALDGQDPVDEAVSLRLARGRDAGSRLWLAGDSGFLLVQDSLVSLAVLPDARGAGLAGDLIAAGSWPGSDAAALPGTVDAEAWSHGNHPAAARLASRLGWRRVRDLWVLRRDNSPLPALPSRDGVTVRSFDGSDHDLAELIRVNAAAFADHPEQGSLSVDDVRERQAQPWWDPAGLLAATDTSGRWLGFHWTKRHSPEQGEVYVVGIDPTAQGRGLGSLLTLAGLHHLYDATTTEVLLYVEADNAPALAVYTKLGFTHAPADTHVMYAS